VPHSMRLAAGPSTKFPLPCAKHPTPWAACWGAARTHGPQKPRPVPTPAAPPHVPQRVLGTELPLPSVARASYGASSGGGMT
jgi:hypothetical protein